MATKLSKSGGPLTWRDVIFAYEKRHPQATLKEIAALFDVSEGTLYRWRNGEGSMAIDDIAGVAPRLKRHDPQLMRDILHHASRGDAFTLGGCDANPEACQRDMAIKLAENSLETIKQVHLALSDGQIDPEERSRISGVIDQVRSTADRLAASLTTTG